MAMDASTLQPIPQPPEHVWGFLGNIPDIDTSALSASYGRLVALYGPIFKLNLLSKRLIILSSQELVNEVCNDSRFTKMLGVLKEVRLALDDGLITAFTHEHNYKLAHKLLMKAFGPTAIRATFPKMLDIITQMLLKWERMGPTYDFDASDEFTRMSFDVIALVGFDYRCHSFYTETTHPFVKSVTGMLTEATQRSLRSNLGNNVRWWAWRNFQYHTTTMHRLCDEIVEDRKQNPKDVDDLLNVMLMAKDKQTGEGLSDKIVRLNVETILAAGYKTTSALLSFTLFELVRNPDILTKAVAEIDAVLGDDDLRLEHLPKLQYIDAILKESLRLHSPAGQIGLRPKHGDGILGGKFAYASTDVFVLNLVDLHRDPNVWGPDAIAFRPERMLDGGFESLPPNSWKPFGHGVRRCSGRDFAMQEALMTTATILQRFEIEFADPTYELKIEQTVTQRPVGMRIKVKLRS